MNFGASRRRLVAAMAGALVVSGAPVHAQAGTVLRFGVLPYLSTRQLLGFFEPLRQHLATALGATVQMLAAPDLRAFARNLRAHEYEVALMPPHFARLAARAWGFRIAAMTTARSNVVVVKRRGEMLTVPAGLRGRELVMPDRIAFTTMRSLQWLRDNRLLPGQDVTVRFVPTINSQIAALDQSNPVAAILPDSLMIELPEEQRKAIEVAAVIAVLPPPILAIDAGVAPDRVAAIRAAVLSFGGAADGKGTLSRSSFVPATMQDLDGIESYAQQLEIELAARD